MFSVCDPVFATAGEFCGGVAVVGDRLCDGSWEVDAEIVCDGVVIALLLGAALLETWHTHEGGTGAMGVAGGTGGTTVCGASGAIGAAGAIAELDAASAMPVAMIPMASADSTAVNRAARLSRRFIASPQHPHAAVAAPPERSRNAVAGCGDRRSIPIRVV